MIERKNIIEILGKRVNVYHSAIITCYNFDPIFFESVYLPTLRRLGITNVIVMTDAYMYDKLLSDSSYHCHQVKMHGYQLVRQENKHGGVFHSKVIMLFGVEEASIIIGSGNITFSGMSNNEEVWNAFHTSGKESSNYPIFKSAWDYIKTLILNSPLLVKRQAKWIEEQCEWLSTETKEKEILMESGETASLLFNNNKDTIINRLALAVGDAVVEKITVVAPFYDSCGSAIKELNKRFKPKEFHCVMDLAKQSAPFGLIRKNEGIKFWNYTDNKSPLHAKIIEIHASNGSWLLSGSANIGNMALGTNKHRYNEEACVLVHSAERKEYIKELGLKDKFTSLSNDELKEIIPPKYNGTTPSNHILTITSCENRDDKLHIEVSTEGVECSFQIINVELEISFEKQTTTIHNMVIELDENVNPHLVVFTQGDKNISNHCLVVNEINIESCNPDPKLRKLSSLLNDSGLMDNIAHILGLIEFEDRSIQGTVHLRSKGKKKESDENELISREQYDDLKDRSHLNLSMHSGIRILSFLQGVLFKSDNEPESEDELFGLQDENKSDNNAQSSTVDQEERESSEAEEGIKLRNDVYSFLSKMTAYLYTKTKDHTIQEEGSNSMPIEHGDYLPKLIGKAGLNESSSFAIASTIVTFLVKNFNISISRDEELRDIFYECACMFFAVYGQKFTEVLDTNKKRKIHNMLKDATVLLYVSLCFFSFRKEEYELILTVLNSFVAWKEEPDTLNEIIESFRNEIASFDVKVIDNKTYLQINSLYEIYSAEEIPINSLTKYEDEIYLYRHEYGFFCASDIRYADNSCSLTYFHPRYPNNRCTINGMTKYKGYRDRDLLILTNE